MPGPKKFSEQQKASAFLKMHNQGLQEMFLKVPQGPTPDECYPDEGSLMPFSQISFT